jgi:enoyl-CoA hydratase/carnithine racemase
MTDTEPVIVDHDGYVAIIRLNRPDKGNAYTSAMGAALHDAFVELDSDRQSRVIIVTGNGSAFCVGLDLSAGDSTFGDEGPLAGQRRQLETERLLAPFQLRTPVIAAMNGHAVGVGITLAMQCDIRVAATDAKLGFVFTRRGIIAEAYGHWTVPRTIGLARTAELFFTGRTFSGAEAESWGVVNHAVPKADVLPTAMGIAQEIARESSPAALALSKALLWQSTELTAEQVYDAEIERIRFLGASADAREGVRAFLEKRPPEWELDPADLPTFL